MSHETAHIQHGLHSGFYEFIHAYNFHYKRLNKVNKKLSVLTCTTRMLTVVLVTLISVSGDLISSRALMSVVHKYLSIVHQDPDWV